MNTYVTEGNAVTDAKVKLPKEFFSKSKLEYTDWRWAFWREVIQNCYDAAASNIDISIKQNGEHTVLTINDDGCGMSREILTGTLLCMGGSMKAAGAVGGFGYAKSLLFFAHAKYSIDSLDHKVVGSGGDYAIQQCPYRHGTKVSIWMLGESVEEQEQILCNYVYHMRMPREVHLTLNGRALQSVFEDFEYKVQTKLGPMLFRDVRGNASRLVVSVGGLPMFVHNVYASGVDAFSGVVDLKGNTFELLTANRDSLKGEHSSALTRLVQGLIEERFSYKSGKVIDMTLNYTTPQTLVVGDSTTLIAEAAVAKNLEEEDLDPEESFRYMYNSIFPHNWNIRVHNTVGKKSDQVNADTISVSNVVSLLRKAWVQRLAVSWKYVVLQLLKTQFLKDQGVVRGTDPKIEEYYFRGKRIATGFILAKSIEGINITAPESGEIFIMCNPMVFTKDFEVADLCDLAIHECSHLLASGHHDLFIDVDMKLRRSLRRLLPEIELTLEAKKVVRAWKADSIQI